MLLGKWTEIEKANLKSNGKKIAKKLLLAFPSTLTLSSAEKFIVFLSVFFSDFFYNFMAKVFQICLFVGWGYHQLIHFTFILKTPSLLLLYKCGWRDGVGRENGLILVEVLEWISPHCISSDGRPCWYCSFPLFWLLW